MTPRSAALLDRLAASTDTLLEVIARAAGTPDGDGRAAEDHRIVSWYREKLEDARVNGSAELALRAAGGLTSVNKGLADPVWPTHWPIVGEMTMRILTEAIEARESLLVELGREF